MSDGNPLRMALSAPTHGLCYELGVALGEHARGRHVVECASATEILEFADAGHASVVRHDLHAEVVTEWQGPGAGSTRSAKNAWFRVCWDDHHLELVTVSWEGVFATRTRAWVVADDADIALAFYEALAEWSHEVRGEILVFESGCFRKSAALFAAVQRTTFDSLVLEPTLKASIEQGFQRFITGRALYQRLGIPWKRGVLMLGPPGNGKTHCVKALVRELKLPCIYVTSFKARYADDDAMVRQVFQRARRTTPCLLVLEDLDSLLTKNNRAYFLNELDGFADNDGVITLATTNYPERLDPSLLERPSRFDVKYTFAPPASHLRQDYLRRRFSHLDDALAPDGDTLSWVASQTEGFSFAFLKELCIAILLELANDATARLRSAAECHIESLRAQLSGAKPKDDEGEVKPSG